MDKIPPIQNPVEESRDREVKRREFLHGLTAAAIGRGQGLPGRSPGGGSGDCPVFRDVCAQHYSLAKLRSQRSHETLVASFQKEGARPVIVAARQLQNECGGKEGKERNLRRMIAAIDGAAKEGVQIIAFPEMCLPGYFTAVSGTPAEAKIANHALADEVGESQYLRGLTDRARAKQMVVVFGFCERDGASYYDAVGVIDADGTWLGTRRKNPLSPGPFDLDSFTQPDPADRSAVFRTRYATIGVSICFDGEFPESVRRMRLAGAEILLWCNAGTGSAKVGSSNRLHYSGSYAQANQMWVVCCNAVGQDQYGTSLIVGPSGEPLVILPTDLDCLAVSKVNLALSDKWELWRANLDPIWGN